MISISNDRLVQIVTHVNQVRLVYFGVHELEDIIKCLRRLSSSDFDDFQYSPKQREKIKERAGADLKTLEEVLKNRNKYKRP